MERLDHIIEILGSILMILFLSLAIIIGVALIAGAVVWLLGGC